MNIIETIPIAKGPGLDTLSYFTALSPTLGSIVSVPLRKKNISAIVVSLRPAEDIKSEIKNAPYALKKLEKIKSTPFFSPLFMTAVEELATYYATSPSAILQAIVPEYILKNIGKLKKVQLETVSKNTFEVSVSQGDNEERHGSWKSLIRQEFAHKKSVFFLVPTIEDAKHVFTLIEKGIEGYAFLLHGALTQKEIISTWNKAVTEEHPVVVVATGGFLSLPRSDIETIIVEKESSRTYKISRRPFLDLRTVAEAVARARGIKIYYGDTVLRTETLEREHSGEASQASPFKFRSLSTARDTLVDMKEGPFKILSFDVQKLIQETRDESKHMMILATRRGLSPSTICGDCQTMVVCNNCSSPVVLHKKGDKTFFMCHRCGERRSAEEYCKHCQSWKLITLGIGIDMVEEKIREMFPNILVFKIDTDATPTDKSAHAVVEKFRASPGSILIGTEMMLHYMHENVENSAIISLDSLFALPDFRIQEKILGLLVSVRTLTREHFIVQTRKKDEKVFEYGLKGNMSDFFREEITSRKKFKYPPFTTLIKLTLEGKKERIVKEMEKVHELLDPYEVEVFPAFTQTVKGEQVLHGLIRLPKSDWPKRDLVEKLRTLSPEVTVKVDPETLL
ncbi:MAG: primosomal protein N' [Patescibacteria group bacterium]